MATTLPTEVEPHPEVKTEVELVVMVDGAEPTAIVKVVHSSRLYVHTHDRRYMVLGASRQRGRHL